MQKRLVLICGASLDPARSNDRRRVCPGRYKFGIRADPRDYTDVCGQVRGHVGHDVCDPPWLRAWHMCQTGCTDVFSKRERSCGPTRTSVPLSGGVCDSLAY